MLNIIFGSQPWKRFHMQENRMTIWLNRRATTQENFRLSGLIFLFCPVRSSLGEESNWTFPTDPCWRPSLCVYAWPRDRTLSLEPYSFHQASHYSLRVTAGVRQTPSDTCPKRSLFKCNIPTWRGNNIFIRIWPQPFFFIIVLFKRKYFCGCRFYFIFVILLLYNKTSRL